MEVTDSITFTITLQKLLDEIEEEIDIKPSTELIPDEFPIESNGNVLVQFLLNPTDQSAPKLANKLKDLGFAVEKTKISELEGYRLDISFVYDFIEEVKKKVKLGNYAGMLLVLPKVLHFDPDVVKKIWGAFTTKECPELKDKPKIFLIQSCEEKFMKVQIDSKRQEPSPYDSPSEADLLIILDTYSGDKDFLDSFRDQLDTHGIKEDIVTLAALSLGSGGRPLIISTMTRKFYFERHHIRGHHYNISENQNKIREILELIKEDLNRKRPKTHKPVMVKGYMKSTTSSGNKTRSVADNAAVNSTICCIFDSSTRHPVSPERFELDTLQTRKNNKNPVAERGYMKSTKSSSQKMRSLTDNAAGLGSSKSTATTIQSAPAKSTKKPLIKSTRFPTTRKSNVTSVQSKPKE